jgi:hypothetical protein
MGLRSFIFVRSTEKSIPSYSRAEQHRHLPCTQFLHLARNEGGVVNNHQTEGLKGRKQRRDFYCVVADAFYFFARRAGIVLGSAWAFVGALFVILVWLITGPTFHFSDTWQLIINTATTIIIFLMVVSDSKHSEP